MLTVAELKTDLKNLTEKELYAKYLLGQDVWYFKEHTKTADYYKKYDEIKYFISDKLDIHFNNIAIIGSAKTGISFSPRKKFSEFSEGSDIDIIIVSNKHYTSIWSAYLEMFYNEIAIKEYKIVNKCIFKGFISLKDPTIKHKIIEEWVKTSNNLVKDLQLKFGIDNDINYRIYDSWESVEKYHLFGMKILKQGILNDESKDYQAEKDKNKVKQGILKIINLLITKAK